MGYSIYNTRGKTQTPLTPNFFGSLHGFNLNYLLVLKWRT